MACFREGASLPRRRENQFARNYTAFSSRFRFNGKEWDEETGNFYYGARYYDPKISVWLSVDPRKNFYPGLSPYNYTINNPLGFVDPDGELPIPVITGIVGGLIGLGVAIYQDKSWEETLAATAGGAAGGFLAGCGAPLVAGMGGATTISAAGAVYVNGGMGIIGYLGGGKIKRGIERMLGVEQRISEERAMELELTFALPNLLLGNAMGKVVSPFLKGVLGREISEEFLHNREAVFIKDMIKRIKNDPTLGPSVSNRQAEIAAQKMWEAFKNVRGGTVSATIYFGDKSVDVATAITGQLIMGEIKSEAVE